MKQHYKQMTRIIIILTLIVAAWYTDCTAQNLLGFNGFYSMNTISVDSMGMKRKIFAEPGYGGGIVYKHLELKNIIGFQAEANIDYTGFRIEPNDSTYYKQNIQYVTIPLMMHINIGKYAVKAVFAIGPYASFHIGHSKAETNIPDIDSSIVSRIHHGKYNAFTYGLYGEAGIAICSKAGIFEIKGRASVGMSKMKDLGALALMNYMTSRQLAIGVSYLVPFGKGEKYYIKREKIKKEKDKEIDNGVDANIETGATEPADGEQTVDPKVPEDPQEEENWEERKEN